MQFYVCNIYIPVISVECSLRQANCLGTKLLYMRDISDSSG